MPESALGLFSNELVTILRDMLWKISWVMHAWKMSLGMSGNEGRLEYLRSNHRQQIGPGSAPSRPRWLGLWLHGPSQGEDRSFSSLLVGSRFSSFMMMVHRLPGNVLRGV